MARERLFALLDEHRRCPAVCVVGPPGAGKTTLIGSWLEARDLPGIWYQVDPGDADIATFFYYLAQAAAPHTPPDGRPLPLLTPEYLHDIPAFNRRFFRELFSRLSGQSVLVLDNYQEVAPEERFHEIVSAAVDEVPAGVTLIAISRANPPSHYARLIANENVTLVEWDELRLTLEETRAIASTRANLSDSDVRALHERSGGWAAGLTLLIERDRRPTHEAGAERIDGLDRVFDYFAAQIFERAAPDLQRFLVASAYLPRVTVAMAKALTGREDAADILEGLYRRHLFTHRRPGAEPTYQFHALFQTFLRSKAKILLSEDERGRLTANAARLLECAGAMEDAFALYRESGQWDAVVSLIRHEAAQLIGQGRGQTLREWIQQLPQSVVESEPWVQYWQAASQIAIAPAQARIGLERAFDGFSKRDELTGQTLAASGMIETYYREMSFFQPMDRWIAAIEELLSRIPTFDSLETRLRVYSTTLLGIMYREPRHPLRADYAREVLKALDADLDINTRLTAATFLLSYCTLTASLDIGRRLIEKVDLLATRPEVSPVNQHWWYARQGYFYYYTGELDKALRVLNKADAIAEAHGISPVLTFSHYRMMAELAIGDFKAALACVSRVEKLFDPSRGMDVWHLRLARLECLLATGREIDLSHEAAEGLDAAQRSGMYFLEVRSWLSVCWALAGSGPLERALESVEQTRAWIEGGCFAYHEADLLLAAAYAQLRHGRHAQAHEALRQAFSLARRTDAPVVERWFRGAMQTLCAEALSAGIESDYVRRFIRRHGLSAPEDADHWPWPIRIHTLGRFELLRDDEPVEFSGKTPRKPLSLLKAIVAFGGDGVAQPQLIDALWPQEEGDAARRAFGVALVRLRRLLDVPDAVILNGQRVSLNPRLCWVDTWAFERFVGSAERALGNGGTGAVIALAERAIQLYRGNFLPADSDASWTLQARLRLKTRFTRFVETLGLVLEQTGEWQKAADCYYRGLEADDLIEEFYLGLMRCSQALNRPADGIAVFRRMRQTLSVVLNVQPSPAAETLAGELREAGMRKFE